MAAGVLTVTLDADSPASDGTQLISTGTVTFSTVYDQTNGDSFDPASMGLSTLADIRFDPAPNADETAWVQPALKETLPAVSKLFFPTQSLLHVKALAIVAGAGSVTVSTSDDVGLVGVSSGSPVNMSAFTSRFRAWGT